MTATDGFTWIRRLSFVVVGGTVLLFFLLMESPFRRKNPTPLPTSTPDSRQPLVIERPDCELQMWMAGTVFLPGSPISMRLWRGEKPGINLPDCGPDDVSVTMSWFARPSLQSGTVHFQIKAHDWRKNE